MIRPALAALVLTLAPLPALAAPSGVADQIQRLEDAVNRAYAANDLKTYFSYYAPDLRALFPEGPTTKPAYIQEWTQLVKSGGGIEAFTASDMRIQVSPHGDVAVASYQAVARTRTPGKASQDERFFETDVWFKRAGAWKIVEIHYSDAPPAK